VCVCVCVCLFVYIFIYGLSVVHAAGGEEVSLECG